MELDQISRDAYPHTALFCEENIWWLIQSLSEHGMDISSMRVLFFSNPERRVAMLRQRAAKLDEPVVWDYHVVLCIKQGGRDWILDFDTRLPFVSRYSDYMHHSFPEQSALPEQFRAWIRVVPAKAYLERFYSDRSHMMGVVPEEDFPEWPVIMPVEGDGAVSLYDYWDMQKQLSDGSYTYQLASPESS